MIIMMIKFEFDGFLNDKKSELFDKLFFRNSLFLAEIIDLCET